MLPRARLGLSVLYEMGYGRRRRPQGRLRPPPDERLRARRWLRWGALLILILSLPLRQPLLVVAAFLLAALAIIPELWYRYGLLALHITRQPATTRATFGDTVQCALTVENRKALPLPSLEIEDRIPPALRLLGNAAPTRSPSLLQLEHTLSLRSFERIRRQYTILAAPRGAYTFGPMTLRCPDPFGILTREAQRPIPATLLVHPLTPPLERLGLPANAPFGDRKSQQRLLEDPLRVVGVRPYAPGDEPRRIHWKATARVGVLQSKTFEPSTRQTLAIFLDIRTQSKATLSDDPALAELAISATASVATWAIEHAYAVGVYSNGALSPFGDHDDDASPALASPAPPRADDWLAREIARVEARMRLRLPPATRVEHLRRILDGLARLLTQQAPPIERFIEAERQRLPPGATIVYIGAEPLIDVGLILALRRLRAQGHAVTLLLTHPERPHPSAQPDPALYLSGLTVHTLGDQSTWRLLVRETLRDLDPTIPTEANAHAGAPDSTPPDPTQQPAPHRPPTLSVG